MSKKETRKLEACQLLDIPSEILKQNADIFSEIFWANTILLTIVPFQSNWKE